ncbi:adenylate/guanylate cyclase domain-containing protein [Mycobacterium paragordonae]|uniref:Adenylate/guanylate cyclase domain-containing protein n=1 Tax=Mycobacterium paragordonae TaxID=1389713 RepID=A0A4V3AWS8_9MYCO|nr:adenylate/guanylate cyclase domain-containing protein [Mycobacterium paragordonae]MDP7738089.1 adenylate/guanylate cyclase domain-containing protein [Mycobacterium paragordonae]TDK92143.1 adenylate/guanylate cyclase domain-containing protein [Mycobacterium paragordonae]TDL04442.1 adenylate/guanylate cyclase domain-containing protein [Mycobacterium paragordonae]
MFSETRYAMNGDLRVAYRASPEGERDIVLVPAFFSNCEDFPEQPSLRGWAEAMTSLGRLIFFDQPGTGVSDPVTSGALPTLELWADSITAVLDDLGSREAVLVAMSSALATGALFAATHPSRTAGLVVLEAYADPMAKRTEGPAAEQTTAALAAMWGTGEFMHVINPDMPWNEEIRAAWARYERLGASPGTAALMMSLITETDVRALLPTVRVPTLVLHHTDDPFFPPEWGKDVADLIAGAKYVELPGRNMFHFVEPDWRASFQEIAQFLTGHQADVADDRVLATVLFTDIVDSTRRAAEIGDRDWHALLDAHDAVVRSQLARYRGREVNTSGDGFLAMFDGPQRAIRCAVAIRDAVQALGIEVRAGLHTGECEIRGADIGGIAVHIGARVSALAGPNEVLVSSTLRDLVIGSGLEFADRGVHQLKGVPGEWRLFAVASG